MSPVAAEDSFEPLCGKGIMGLLSVKAQGAAKGIRKTEKIFAFIGGGMLFAMMALGAADFIGRYVFNSPIKGSLETIRILMPGMFAFSLAFTQAARAHVRVEFVIDRFSHRPRAVADFAADLLALVFFGFVAWQTLDLGLETLNQHRLIFFTPRVSIPLAIVHLMISLGAIVLCLELIIQLVSSAFGDKKDKIKA